LEKEGRGGLTERLTSPIPYIKGTNHLVYCWGVYIALLFGRKSAAGNRRGREKAGTVGLPVMGKGPERQSSGNRKTFDEKRKRILRSTYTWKGKQHCYSGGGTGRKNVAERKGRSLPSRTEGTEAQTHQQRKERGPAFPTGEGIRRLQRGRRGEKIPKT